MDFYIGSGTGTMPGTGTNTGNLSYLHYTKEVISITLYQGSNINHIIPGK